MESKLKAKRNSKQLLIVNESNLYQVYKAFARTTPAHGHSHFLLMLVISGTCHQTLNGKDVILKPGTIIMMSPCDFHCNHIEDTPVEYYGVQFDPAYLDFRLSKQADYSIYPLVGELESQDIQYVSGLFELLLHESSYSANPTSGVYSQALIELLTIITVKKCQSFGSSNTFNENIRKALSYIHIHFREPINVRKVADVAGYSPAHFSVKFTGFLGVSFQEYVTNLRLRYGRNLLVSTNYTITECALESGFNSVAYFSNVFRKKFGCSPSEYLKQLSE